MAIRVVCGVWTRMALTPDWASSALSTMVGKSRASTVACGGTSSASIRLRDTPIMTGRLKSCSTSRWRTIAQLCVPGTDDNDVPDGGSDYLWHCLPPFLNNFRSRLESRRRWGGAQGSVIAWVARARRAP